MTCIKFIVIQDKEGGNQFAALKLFKENGINRFARVTDFTTNKNDVLSFINDMQSVVSSND